jgi:hypothetical protein
MGENHKVKDRREEEGGRRKIKLEKVVCLYLRDTRGR